MPRSFIAILAALAFASCAEDAPKKEGDPKPPPAPAAPEPEGVTIIDPDAGVAPPPADIFAAAKGGSLDYVKNYIEADAALVNARSKLNDTPLHWAASCGQTEVARYLLAKLADANAKNITGATPLHLAARMGYKEIMDLLIVCKADVNARDDDEDDTPLHSAVRKGKVDCVELLLKNGASVNAKMKDGTLPLDLAEKLAKTEMAKLLRKHGGQSARTEDE